MMNLRLVLVIGLMAFWVAVSVDAGHNRAEAADLVDRAVPVQAAVPTQVVGFQAPIPGNTDLVPAPPASEPDLESQLMMARRLGHGMMTKALMTTSRLTEAHLSIN